MPRHIRAIAVQPQWHVHDFLSARRFQAWLRSQLQAAQPHFHPTRPNLVVLTELNGMPLVLRGGILAAYSGTFARAAALILLQHLPAALTIMLREKVLPIRALQLARSSANTALYLKTCQGLAREYGVYLVCGSAPTPHFRQEGKRLRRGSALYNQTHIFAPSGELIGTADKVYLTPDELQGGIDLSAGKLSNLRVFPTPAGDLGVAISLDAFKNDVIDHLTAQGCTVLLQPDANGSPWSAKEGLPPDPQQLRDQPEAWLGSSWAVTNSGQIPYAVNPMVVGNLLDMTFDGQSAITGPAHEAPTLQSYAMTAPRTGFLALLPWLGQGGESLDELRELGEQRRAHSGHPQENSYRTGVIAANLHLPDQTMTAPQPTPHEEALRAYLSGKARLSSSDTLSGLWLPLALLGLAAFKFARKPSQR